MLLVLEDFHLTPVFNDSNMHSERAFQICLRGLTVNTLAFLATLNL